MTEAEFLSVLKDLYRGGAWPKPFNVIQAANRAEAGEDISQAARDARTVKARIQGLLGESDKLLPVLGLSVRDIDNDSRRRAEQMLGQLLLGRCAEMAFEDIYRSEMQAHELELRDIRESRTDTDYRLYNGAGRPVYRINIKFHGASFRRARELVGLETEDCFPLATCKIHSALQKQDVEGLPYLFAVVGVRHLSAEQVGRVIPSRLTEATAYVYQAPKSTGMRDFEDKVIDHLVETAADVFTQTHNRVRAAEWCILSARKADILLHNLLFQRVFALRVRGFARQFRGAELDMHFSLSRDLVPLRTFLAVLRAEGPAKVVTLLERGEY